MSDTPKPIVELPPSVEAIEDSELKGGRNDMGVHDRENAVGYSEYLEARDIEFSDIEVGRTLLGFTTAFADKSIGKETAMETRSCYPPYVPHHSSPSVHG